MTTLKATCTLAGCRAVYGFSIELEPAEARRLQRKILAVAGWLVVGADTYCASCSRTMQMSLGRLSGAQRRSVCSAIADSLHLGRVEVVGG